MYILIHPKKNFRCQTRLTLFEKKNKSIFISGLRVFTFENIC